MRLDENTSAAVALYIRAREWSTWRSIGRARLTYYREVGIVRIRSAKFTSSIGTFTFAPPRNAGVGVLTTARCYLFSPYGMHTRNPVGATWIDLHEIVEMPSTLMTRRRCCPFVGRKNSVDATCDGTALAIANLHNSKPVFFPINSTFEKYCVYFSMDF